MDASYSLLILGFIAALLLWFSWGFEYGPWRGSLAFLLRILWCLPLVLAFFPQTKSEPLPRSLALKPIHVLVDDSQSMTQQLEGEKEPLIRRSQRFLDDLNQECARLGCQTKVVKLSELSPLVQQGYTPLNESIESWLFTTGGEPWLLLSDGADYKPEQALTQRLHNVGSAGQKKSIGAVVTVAPEKIENIWIDSVDLAPISFDGKNVDAKITVRRLRQSYEPETIQVQVSGEEKVLATSNATFVADESELQLSVTFPPLTKGQHLVTFKVLPASYEKALWDNMASRSIDVLPNTFGVLHLLGAPSWDGRFLRRYLKSEPKYDLISFFILRDPIDAQAVNERELSLIPFPVDRLFNQELPNFNIVIIQNFALFQFLEPNYQKNLVDFVRQGGSLLFIGGPRALQPGDYRGSPLAKILPFQLPQSASNPLLNQFFGGGGAMPQDRTGPFYDPTTKFSIQLAKPTSAQRELANVYDYFAEMIGPLSQDHHLTGMHHTENVPLRENEATPLLYAKLANGSTVPLAVASYPGKGRAVWLFTDSLWRMAIAPSGEASRSLYNEFFAATMQWLLKQEVQKPLIVRQLRFALKERQTEWSMLLSGPAVPYLFQNDSWSLQLCQLKIPADKVMIERTSQNLATLSGTLPSRLAEGTVCKAQLEGNHDAFGSVKVSYAERIPTVYRDEELQASPHRMEQFAQYVGANYFYEPKLDRARFDEWLAQLTDGSGVSLPTRFKTHRDFYWVLETWWCWLLFLALPVEILVRRWPLIMGRSQRRRLRNNPAKVPAS